MSLSARKELLASVAPRYREAGKAEKGRILDELVATCGYDRKYAICALRRPPKSKNPAPRKRNPTYGPDVGGALLRLWNVSGGLCPKRLVPVLPQLLDALERHGEIALPQRLKEKLLTLSVSTAQRQLRRLRRQSEYGISTTKPGTLLRQQIPLHTFSDWKDAQPGFLEIDLVAHCADTAAGQFVYTLTATDVATGWTEHVALPNRGQLAVLAGLETIKAWLPFPLKGIDTDNGSEFINVTVVLFCQKHRITFTRCRPYKKNDQCHVEQKNGAVIRPLTGYARYEGPEAVDHLNKLYVVHRLRLNFFCPSMKLVDKQRNGAKVSKKYDTPQTPFARLIGYDVLTEKREQTMKAAYQKLNPAELMRQIEELSAGLSRYAVRTSNSIPTLQKRRPRLPNNLFGKIPK